LTSGATATAAKSSAGPGRSSGRTLSGALRVSSRSGKSSGAGMTGIRPCGGPTTAFARVVSTQHVRTGPVGDCYRSSRAAKASGWPPGRWKWYGCFRLPTFAHA
jgi:hypothetical protein